ncbi:MAG: cobalamin-binding protein [Planctomycetes bacterium]|nr:cobalamin-binding protein [Planctomycetota bacterium]
MVSLDLYPRRIVCLTEETTETLYLLGEQERIVGISGYTVRPPEARRDKPKVSAYLTADIPKIEALHPDLILAFSDLQADIVRELVKIGLNVVVFNQRSIEEILRMVATLGGLVGRQREGEALANRLRENVERVRAMGAALPKRPRVYFEEWPDPMISGIRWVSELVEVAGGEDSFAELRSEGLAKKRVVAPEEVARRRPDVILASWCGRKVRADQIASRPGWEEIPAVRAGRIFEIKSSIILQPGPAALTDGLEALHRHIAATALGPETPGRL